MHDEYVLWGEARRKEVFGGLSLSLVLQAKAISSAGRSISDGSL